MKPTFFWLYWSWSKSFECIELRLEIINVIVLLWLILRLRYELVHTWRVIQSVTAVLQKLGLAIVFNVIVIRRRHIVVNGRKRAWIVKRGEGIVVVWDWLTNDWGWIISWRWHVRGSYWNNWLNVNWRGLLQRLVRWHASIAATEVIRWRRHIVVKPHVGVVRRGDHVIHDHVILLLA